MSDPEHLCKFKLGWLSPTGIGLRAELPSIIVKHKLTLHISPSLLLPSLIFPIFMASEESTRDVFRHRDAKANGSRVFCFELLADEIELLIFLHTQCCSAAPPHPSLVSPSAGLKARSPINAHRALWVKRVIHIDIRVMALTNLTAQTATGLTSGLPPLIQLIFVRANTWIRLRQLCGSGDINTVITLITLNSKFVCKCTRTQTVRQLLGNR